MPTQWEQSVPGLWNLTSGSLRTLVPCRGIHESHENCLLTKYPVKTSLVVQRRPTLTGHSDTIWLYLTLYLSLSVLNLNLISLFNFFLSEFLYLKASCDPELVVMTGKSAIIVMKIGQSSVPVYFDLNLSLLSSPPD